MKWKGDVGPVYVEVCLNFRAFMFGFQWDRFETTVYTTTNFGPIQMIANWNISRV